MAAVSVRLQGRRPSLVLDLGAGTGIFLPMWRQVGADVIAVEPATSMIDIARQTIGEGSFYVRSVAEAIPLASDSVDVVWVSTAIHHFANLPLAVEEIARVLAKDGRIIIRTFLPEHSKWVAFELFPAEAQAKARGRNLTLAQLRDLFAARGFRVVGVDQVQERRRSFERTADWIERMRSSDSLLTAMTGAEIESALAALRDRPRETDLLELSLVTFAR